MQTPQHSAASKAASKAASTDPSMREAVVGRWDMTVHTPEGDRPSWLEIQPSGGRTLVGRFVGVVGSARPIARIDLHAGNLAFAIPPQYEPGTGDLRVEGSLESGRLSGQIELPDGRRFDWSASRAPVLRPQAIPAFGERVSLFNGIDLSGWKVLGESHWVASGGVLQNMQTGGNLVSERLLTDFQLHIEYRYPKSGNSGVYLRGRYEVQIIDHPNEVPNSHDLGAVYGFLTPSEIVTNGPGSWNAFDITLTGRMVTIESNGTTIISNQEIPGITGGALDSDEGAPGPLLLQGDHGPIEYRNILLQPAV